MPSNNVDYARKSKNCCKLAKNAWYNAEFPASVRAWPNFMDLLTVSTESALTEAGNSVLTTSVFRG